MNSVSLGADSLYNNKLALGSRLFFFRLDVDSRVNRGNTKGSSIGLTPYASYILKNIFSVNGYLGYSFIDIDNKLIDGATVDTGSPKLL